MRSPDEALSLVVVGAGPRAVGVLERLAANLDDRWDGRTPLVIDLVDPHPAGGGRIWRFDQSPLLKLNSMAVDVTMFTDERSTVDGLVRPGPSLIEWVERVRAGEVTLDRTSVDTALAAELAHLGPASFPTRRLQSLYLRWFTERAIEELGARAVVRERRARVEAVTAVADGRSRVLLDDGSELDADAVLYALGHTGVDPEPHHRRLIAFADRHELFYLPPAFTSDADLDAISAGQRVIVRGFGLAAVDLIVLLTEGRGGRFVRDVADPGVPEILGRLRYEPSGSEPRIVVGSRRGVPYHSKIASTLQGEAPAARFFTRAIATAIEAEREQLDFARDIWPLIAQELLWGYYRELFTGHPDRVATDWDHFAARFEVLDPRASIIAGPDIAGSRTSETSASGSVGHALPSFTSDADEQAVTADASLLTHLIESAVPDPVDRVFLPELDRPLAGLVFDDPERLQQGVRDYITRDLRLRTLPEHSATLGLFIALLTALFTVAELTGSPKWTARSRIEDVYGWWLGYFSFIASGPPAHRLEELVALSECGLVDFLGGEIRVDVDDRTGEFRATSPNADRVVVASALVDARLPATDIARSDNGVLRRLLESGAALEEIAEDAGFRASTGRLSVRESDRRVLLPRGGVAERSYAVGPYTSSPFVGAFARPRTDAMSFRENDQVARAILGDLSALAAARASGADPRLAAGPEGRREPTP